jgi:pyruvate/2-oxoglutarate dehydrogenase complex dihydrolipoamide dehydrogenase (E3) component
LLRAKTEEIVRLNGIYSRLLDNSGVDTHIGSGRLLDKNTVQVTSPEVRSRSKFLYDTLTNIRAMFKYLRRARFSSRLVVLL